MGAPPRPRSVDHIVISASPEDWQRSEPREAVSLGQVRRCGQSGRRGQPRESRFTRGRRFPGRCDTQGAWCARRRASRHRAGRASASEANRSGAGSWSEGVLDSWALSPRGTPALSPLRVCGRHFCSSLRRSRTGSLRGALMRWSCSPAFVRAEASGGWMTHAASPQCGGRAWSPVAARPRRHAAASTVSRDSPRRTRAVRRLSARDVPCVNLTACRVLVSQLGRSMTRCRLTTWSWS